MNIKQKPDLAFILAAGQGKRLRPYTDTMPKPMVPINGKPIIDHTLEKLEKDGINNVTINLHYLGDRIENHLKGRKNPSLNFSRETVLLDTGGGVKKALNTLNGKPFYLINGDAFWTDPPETTALQQLADAWNPDIMDILLLLQPVKHMVLTEGVGDYNLNENNQAVRSHDKSGAHMFAGIRITKPEIFNKTTEDAFSFLDLMDKAETEGKLYGLVHEGEWHHISTPGDLDRINASFTGMPNTKTA